MCRIYNTVERFMGQILISAAGHTSVLICKWRCVLCGHCFRWSQGSPSQMTAYLKPRKKNNLAGVKGAGTGAKCLRERCLLWTLKPWNINSITLKHGWWKRGIYAWMWKSHWCSKSAPPPTMVLPLGVSSCKAHKHRSQILSWKSDPSTPFLCIPGWERSFMDETEGTHKMWFKVAIRSVSVTLPCPLRPSQASFLIRATGRSQAGLRWRQLLLQDRGRSYLMSPGDSDTWSSVTVFQWPNGPEYVFQIGTIFFELESSSIFFQRRHVFSDPQLCSFIHSFSCC